MEGEQKRAHGSEKEQEGEAEPSEPTGAPSKIRTRVAEDRKVGFGERPRPPRREHTFPFHFLLKGPGELRVWGDGKWERKLKAREI